MNTSINNFLFQKKNTIPWPMSAKSDKKKFIPKKMFTMAHECQI